LQVWRDFINVLEMSVSSATKCTQSCPGVVSEERGCRLFSLLRTIRRRCVCQIWSSMKKRQKKGERKGKAVSGEEIIF
jgi:hypothetical protein